MKNNAKQPAPKPRPKTAAQKLRDKKTQEYQGRKKEISDEPAPKAAPKPSEKFDRQRRNKQGRLKQVHPFLRQNYRVIEESETTDPAVLEELFPGSKKKDLFKLKANYEFQK